MSEQPQPQPQEQITTTEFVQEEFVEGAIEEFDSISDRIEDVNHRIAAVAFLLLLAIIVMMIVTVGAVWIIVKGG